MLPTRSRIRSRARAVNNNIFKTLSTFDDLYIFEPKKAIGDDLVIADTVGSNITMSQTTAANRPTKNGQYFDLGTDNIYSLGVTTSASITFRELFIVCEYDLSTFDNYATIVSGTGALGEKRIMGNTATDDLITSSSINASGLVRIDNATETAVNLLPLSLSVLHSCSDYTTPADISDTITVGYNTGNATRAWQGRLGVMIFCRTALNDTQRQEIVDIMKQYHGL